MTNQTHPLLTLFGEDFTRKTRQCVSCNLCRQFCPVFPQLFALLRQDSQSTESINAEAYTKLLDECWLCGRCELRCPGNLEFSQQVIRLRLKNSDGPNPEDWLLTRPQEVGRLGSLIAPLANALLGNETLRRWGEGFTGIDHRAPPPRFQNPTFRQWFAKRRPRKDTGEPRSEAAEAQSKIVNLKSKTERRVAYFTGCHVEYYGRSVGQAAVEVLTSNGVEVICPEFRCCGMPQLSANDGSRAEAKANFNIEQLSKLVEAGYEIVATCSTCSLALKHYYPEFWPSVASTTLAEHTWDIFSYLKMLHDSGELELNLSSLDWAVRYHYPCHARYQRYGNNVIDLLRLIPKLRIDYAAMACCGMGGTYGFKRRYYEQSQQQGAETFDFLEQTKPDCVVTDCPMCDYRIETKSGLKTMHPIELLLRAKA